MQSSGKAGHSLYKALVREVDICLISQRPEASTPKNVQIIKD